MNPKFNITSKTIIAIFALIMLSLMTVIPVGAAWYNLSYKQHCTETFSGHLALANHTLGWGGYSGFSWGSSHGWLWKWNGSSFVIQSEAYQHNYGSSGIAEGSPFKHGITSSTIWASTSGHHASFFSGQKDIQGGIFSCP